MCIRAALCGVLAGLVVALAACSPEAARSRGGGPGADVGNRDAVVETHGDWAPAFHTPLLGRAVRR